MLINSNTIVHSTKITLVPYTKSHVPQYHEWMKDPEIQAATASEPLTIEDEYAMQESWRRDGDKLTFIITKPTAQHGEGEGEPIGDVNLFISTFNFDSDLQEPEHATQVEQNVIGEVELMIAEKSEQGKGYGRAALSLFLGYVLRNQAEILGEYFAAESSKSEERGHGKNENGEQLRRKERFDHLAVKIGQSNERSIKLFESVGFQKVRKESSYFGEFELRLSMHGLVTDGVGGAMGERWGVEGYREDVYNGSREQ